MEENGENATTNELKQMQSQNKTNHIHLPTHTFNTYILINPLNKQHNQHQMSANDIISLIPFL